MVVVRSGTTIINTEKERVGTRDFRGGEMKGM